MSNDKPVRTVLPIAQSIDSVLDTPAAKPTVRPSAKLRPSWIGPPRPERPATPGVTPAMKQHVNVEYSSPGLQPPVYIFTNLSDPQWEAVEMLAEKKDGGEYRFSKAFDVEEGEYQYKFRLGPGDWWVCDEGRPTVDDGVGNKNNLLAVTAHEVKKVQDVMGKTDSKTAAPPPTPKPAESKVAEANHQHPSVTAITSHEPSAPTPLPKHDIVASNKGSETQQTPEHEVEDPLEAERSPDDVESPVMNQDTFDSTAADDDAESSNDSSSSSDDEDEACNSPLLRHESVSPHSTEQEHAPLFRHESIALGYNHHEHAAPAVFPNKIDETIDDYPHDSPHSQPLSEASLTVPSLPSVQEADEELEKIRQAEEEEYGKEEESGEEMDPLRPGEPEDADFEPKTEIIEIEEVVLVEVVDRRKSNMEGWVEKVGGKNSVLAIAVGLLVAAAGVVAMRYI